MSAVKKCENCDTPLPDHVDCRCDTEGLWFCLDCWQLLEAEAAHGERHDPVGEGNDLAE